MAATQTGQAMERHICTDWEANSRLRAHLIFVSGLSWIVSVRGGLKKGRFSVRLLCEGIEEGGGGEEGYDGGGRPRRERVGA